MPLDLTHIGEIRQRVPGCVPAGIERQRVPLEHTPEETDRCSAVLKDEPVLRLVAPDDREAKLFVERARSGEVPDGEAHGEIPEG
ncbi:MAG: hypothetical protein H0V12_08045 [Chloroflexi bacterium]|nr:hypothetical protein [Chloroflexota bacterium]